MGKYLIYRPSACHSCYSLSSAYINDMHGDIWSTEDKLVRVSIGGRVRAVRILVSYPDPDFHSCADGLHHRYVKRNFSRSGDVIHPRNCENLGLGTRLYVHSTRMGRSRTVVTAVIPLMMVVVGSEQRR